MKKLNLFLIMLFSLVVNATNLPPPGSVMPQDNDPITGSDKDTTTGNTGGFDTAPTLDTGTDSNRRDQFIVPPQKRILDDQANG